MALEFIRTGLFVVITGVEIYKCIKGYWMRDTDLEGMGITIKLVSDINGPRQNVIYTVYEVDGIMFTRRSDAIDHVYDSSPYLLGAAFIALTYSLF